MKDRIIETVQWVENQVYNHIRFLAGEVLGFVNWLRDRVYDAIGVVQGWINGAVAWVWDNVNGAINWLRDRVYDAVGAVQEWVNNAATWIKDQLVPALMSGVNWLKTQFDGAVGFITQKVGDILQGVASAVGSGIQYVVNWILEHLTYTVNMIVGAINAVVAGVQGALSSIFSGIANAITKGFMPGSPDQEVAIASNVLAQTMWHKQMYEISHMYQSEPSPDQVTQTAMLLVGGALTAGLGGLIVSAAVDATHPFKELMANRTTREILWMVGIPALMASTIMLPATVGLLTPLRYALNSQFTPMQPGPSDIVRFAVRECFDPDRLPALLENYPGEVYAKAMARDGYAGNWAAYFWGAHWVLPPIDMLNEYLYRHPDFKDMWSKYIRYHDYIPEGIPWLREIIYHPWTRVDVRRMWSMRTITEGDMLREYLWGGYNEEHAKGLVLWTKVYTLLPELRNRYKKGSINGEQMLAELVAAGMPEGRAKELIELTSKTDRDDRLAKERDLTKTDILALFRIGQISESQCKTMLMSLGYDDNEASFLIALEKNAMESQIKDVTTSQILSAYRYGVYSRNEAKVKLMQIDWGESAAETVLKLEDARLEQSKTDRMATERDLTRTDILALMSRGQIDKTQAKAMLVSIGYDDTEASYLIALQLDKAEVQLKELSTSQTLKAYRYQIFNRDEAKSKLVEIDWSENAAETLLKLEDISRADAQVERQRERDLTPTQIINAMQKEIIPFETGVEYLAYLGYTEWEITVLLKLEGMK